MNKSTATEILTAVSYGWQDTYPGLTDENKLIKVPQVFTTPNFNGCELNRLFYWDTYFSNRGLIHLGYEFRARSNTDALIQLLNVTGFVPNINVPGGDNRSQVPYLCQMVMDNYLSSGDKDYLLHAA
jgi:alpha,alpha-trehalase